MVSYSGSIYYQVCTTLGDENILRYKILAEIQAKILAKILVKILAKILDVEAGSDGLRI